MLNCNDWRISEKYTDRQTDRQTNKYSYRTGKNYIPPIYFLPGGGGGISFVPNYRILTQVVAEKSLMEKKFTDRQTDKHSYKKGKNYKPPIYFVPGV